MEIKIDDLSNEIYKIVTQYEQNFVEMVNDISDKVADETVKRVREKAPKKFGKYAKSWKKKSFKNFGELNKHVIYADDPHYRLTHLLEYGHVMKNGKRSKQFPHIDKTRKIAYKDYESRIKSRVKNIGN